jgi:hypothetical protein
MKEPKTYMEEKQVLQQMVLEKLENWLSTCKTLKLTPYLTPHRKINSKWIRDLHIRSEALKLLQEKIGKTRHYKPRE